jgi:hypothetical protein
MVLDQARDDLLDSAIAPGTGAERPKGEGLEGCFVDGSTGLDTPNVARLRGLAAIAGDEANRSAAGRGVLTAGTTPLWMWGTGGTSAVCCPPPCQGLYEFRCIPVPLVPLLL